MTGLLGLPAGVNNTPNFNAVAALTSGAILGVKQTGLGSADYKP